MSVGEAVTERPSQAGSPRHSAPRPRRRAPRGSGREFALRWGTFVVAVGLWELATRQADNINFPPPSKIVSRLQELYFNGSASHLFLGPWVGSQMVPSLTRMLIGWLLAALVGIVVGLALGRSDRVMDFVGPVVHFLRAVPPPTLLPVFAVVLRSGDRLQVGFVVFGAVWPVLLNTVEGARSVHRTQRDTMRAFGIGRIRWITRVVLPAAAPKIFPGLRLSLSLALILMVVGEYLQSANGIGFQLQSLESMFDASGVWASILLLGFFGYLLNAVLLMLERRVLRWQTGRDGGL